jgi:hypothetical protein
MKSRNCVGKKDEVEKRTGIVVRCYVSIFVRRTRRIVGGSQWRQFVKQAGRQAPSCSSRASRSTL